MKRLLIAIAAASALTLAACSGKTSNTTAKPQQSTVTMPAPASTNTALGNTVTANAVNKTETAQNTGMAVDHMAAANAHSQAQQIHQDMAVSSAQQAAAQQRLGATSMARIHAEQALSHQDIANNHGILAKAHQDAAAMNKPMLPNTTSAMPSAPANAASVHLHVHEMSPNGSMQSTTIRVKPANDVSTTMQ